MQQFFFTSSLSSYDLHIFNLGTQRCPKNHSYGPAVRRNILLHYIYEGSGIFESGGKTYELKDRQAFVIFPGQTTFYKADGVNPWHYSWMEIAGEGVAKVFEDCGISIENPIINDRRPYDLGRTLSDILEAAAQGRSVYKLSGLLWFFLDTMVECCTSEAPSIPIRQLYVNRAIDYINANYWRKPNVNELSEYIGIDRSYLSKIFKEYKGISPKQYIVEHGISIAKGLLKRHDLSVGDVGRSVGYEDQMSFSKAFKKAVGVSPVQWRRMNL